MEAWIAQLKSTLPDDSDEAREQVYAVLTRIERGEAGVAPASVTPGDASLALSQLMCELAGEPYADYVRQVEAKSGGSASHGSFLERELRPLEFRVGDASLTLMQRPIVQASDLGNAVWEGAVQLTRLLERRVRDGAMPLAQMRVLELGAGVGLVGLAAAVLGSPHVVLTDMRNIVPLLQHNAALNAAACSGATVVCRDLDWTDDPLPDLGGNGFDLIVAADCIYIHSPLAALVAVLERYSAPHTTILFTYEAHDPLSIERFLALAGARGFTIEYLARADDHQKVNTIQIHRSSSSSSSSSSPL
jgi:predicted nicotinamide N-methyase